MPAMKLENWFQPGMVLSPRDLCLSQGEEGWPLLALGGRQSQRPGEQTAVPQAAPPPLSAP